MTVECTNTLAFCGLLWIKAKFYEGKVSTTEKQEVSLRIV